MNIGVPTEIKADEYRVAVTPAGVRELTRHGHHVIVQSGAGTGSGFGDEVYIAAGAECGTVDDVFATSELILKVKEPQPAEVARLSDQHTLFSYLHLAADPWLAYALLRSGARCMAYETVEDGPGLPPPLWRSGWGRA
jgi:alanine dehydrogenase